MDKATDSRLEDGGPAFPGEGSNVLHLNGEITHIPASGGMSMRDYFAAKAMASLIIDPERADQSREECARISYLMADAMIKARKAGAA